MPVPIRHPHRWPMTVAEAEALQEQLKGLVSLTSPDSAVVRTVAGLDVAYAPDQDRVAGAVVVLDAVTLEVVDQGVSVGRVTFPYVPGLFAFREVPALLKALEQLSVTPDLMICDGHGLAHPRRFGLACHLGVLTGIPTIGVGKTPLVGRWDPPGRRRGEWSPLRDGDQVVGQVLRTRDDVKPVFVSVGHLMDLEAARDQVLAQTPRYRLPEAIRYADQLCRSALVTSSRGQS